MAVLGGVGSLIGQFTQPKPPTPPAPAPTGSATNDQILRRLHAIETQMIKNMHHTETVIAAAVQVILAQNAR